MDQACEFCGQGNNLSRRGARFCSTKCRVYWHRAAKRLPDRMTREARWVRADGKRPIRVDGSPASSTDPSSWSSFPEVSASTAGNGFGVMLGGGLGCFDLDHASEADLREFLPTVQEPVLFVERSMSGHGFHVFIEAPEGKGWRRGNLERYTRQRFIRVTGDRVTL